MTLMEVLIAATLLVVLMTVVAITMGMVENVSTTVNTQYQEFDQAVPALAPVQNLLRAEVEPAPTPYTSSSVTSPPTPGFASIGNFAVTFYANIGTAYHNVTSGGTTAGPAKIVAQELDSSGQPITSSGQHCNTTTPCSFQVRRYLPVVNGGVSTCPVTGQPSTNVCQYSSTYTLVSDVLDVVNDPSQTSGSAPTQPIFSYTIFDPATGSGGTAISLSATDVQNQYASGLGSNYPMSTTRNFSVCSLPIAGQYPTIAVSCPLDAIQSVGIDLMIGVKGSGKGTVDNQTIIYRYSENPGGSPQYPYQYTSAVG